jgi:hypothetical protein
MLYGKHYYCLAFEIENLVKIQAVGPISRKEHVTVLAMSFICTIHHLHFGFDKEISYTDVKVIFHFQALHTEIALGLNKSIN